LLFAILRVFVNFFGQLSLSYISTISIPSLHVVANERPRRHSFIQLCVVVCCNVCPLFIGSSTVVHMPITSLGHQGAKSFLRVAQIF